jgi:hypothetical protein
VLFRSLAENERPLLPVEDLRGCGAVLFQHAGQIDDFFDLGSGEFFDGKEMVHQEMEIWGEAGRANDE